MSGEGGNGWDEYKLLVVDKLDGLGKKQDTFDEKLDNLKSHFTKEVTSIREHVAVLRVKAGVWGLIGGAVPAIGILLWAIITRML